MHAFTIHRLHTNRQIPYAHLYASAGHAELTISARGGRCTAPPPSPTAIGNSASVCGSGLHTDRAIRSRETHHKFVLPLAIGPA